MSEEKKILDEQPAETPVEQPVEEKKVEEKVEVKKPISKKTIGIIAGVVAAIAVIAVVLVLVLGGGNNNGNVTPDGGDTPDGGEVNPPADDEVNPPVGGEEEPPIVDTKKDYTLGLGVVVSLDSSVNGNAQVDATVATVILDKDGKIVACKIDVAQNVASLSDGSFSFTKLEQTKAELKEAYGMAAAIRYGMDWNSDGEVKEWYLQAQEFEKHVIGKTAEEVRNMGTQEVPGKGYIISSDEDLLAAGCTIQITDFKEAVAKACEDEFAVSFTVDENDDLYLGVAANSFDDGSTAAGDADGVIKMYTDFGAAVVVDGKIVAALNDAIQPQIKFNEFDEIGTKTFNGTKRELKEGYNMAQFGQSMDWNGDGVVKEWYLQSAAFSAHVVGMTPAEVANMGTQVVPGAGYIISSDEDLLAAGCTIQISAIKAVVAKAAGYVVPAEEYTLGMGVVVGLNSSKTGTAQVDATVATVVLDKDGKIVFCRIDVAQNAATLSDGSFNFTKLEKSKAELLYNYNMSQYGKPNYDNGDDGKVLEWFEQAQLFENYVIGMTVEEVQAIGTQFINNHYIAVDEELLTAGCTIQITDFIEAIVKACNDEFAVSFEAVPGSFTLGVAANSFDDGSTAAGDADGVIKMYTDFAAAVVVDGKIVAALNDAIQPQIKFNEFDEIVTKTFNGTKRELKEGYNMAQFGQSMDWNGDGVVKEWYLQSAAFSAHVVGMTADEVRNMGTQVVPGAGYIISSDEDLLAAGCTIQITAIKAVVAEAADYAR